MSRIKKIMLTLFIAFIAIQFLPSARNESGQLVPDDITKVVGIPQNVQTVLKTSCYDCHSNHTNYPSYSRIQPVRWMQDKHVREGKENLNFSEFGSYSPRKQRNKLRSIMSSIEKGSMPISSYALIHPNARLTAANKLLIKNWAQKAQDSLAQIN